MTVERSGASRIGSRGRGGIERILVVDDIAEMRHTLRRMLRYAGIQDVEMAANIEQARTAIESAQTKQSPFDLVFVDQLMPGGTGLELIEDVISRSLVDRRHTGLFLLSGATERELQAQAKQAGAVALLEKPISSDRLLGVAQRWAAYRSILQAKAAG